MCVGECFVCAQEGALFLVLTSVMRGDQKGSRMDLVS